MHRDPEHTTAARSRKRLALALGLTATVMLVELIGGLVYNSVVLRADAGHMLSDAASLGLALFAIWFAARPSPPHRTYGYYRAEILAAVAQAVLLGLVVCWVIVEAVERIRTSEPFAPVPVLLIGGLGLVVNLVGARLLRSHAGGSLTVRGAYFELLADLFGSVGVIVAALLRMTLGWTLADPVLSLGIALFIVPRIGLLLRDATDVLMEAAPRHMRMADVRQAILDQQGVTEVHDLHVWTIASGRICLSAHVVTAAEADRDQIILVINRHLRETFGIDHTTLQVEGQRVPLPTSEPACDPCEPAAGAGRPADRVAGRREA
jgi:cobalt-zinc-cadmium efflux system protein